MTWWQQAREYLHENGLRWSGYCALSSVSRSVPGLRPLSTACERRMADLEQRRDLPGRHSVRTNRRVWTQWDWQQQGEEWTWDAGLKQSVVDELMRRFLEPGTTILEIGPGGGRWTEELQRLARRLLVVDLSPACLEHCRRRFADKDNIEYHLGDGQSLGFLPDSSLDHVWSYDVFVHISPADTGRYLADLARVLRPGGRAVIHHPAEGGGHGGWRSRTTAAQFDEFLLRSGLRLVERLDAWGPGKRYGVGAYHDAVSVFERPPP